MRNFVLTSESVTAGHPDKLCDQISDAVIDACLGEERPTGCVAECAVATGIVFLSIRHGGALRFDPASLARRVLAENGYEATARQSRTTVMLDTVETTDLVGPVPPEEAEADRMATAFGYACRHTPTRMPLPIAAAHAVVRRLEQASRGSLPWLAPDASAQVAIRFADRAPVALSGIAISYFATGEAPDEEEIRDAIGREVIRPAFAEAPVGPDRETRLVLRRLPGHGGPATHSGLTGRKTADDTYGGFSRNATTALSGKDPSRIDRAAAYAARQVALSVVEAGLAAECEVQLSYVAGDSGPASIEVDSFETGRVPDEEISRLVARNIDLRIGAVLERLDLWNLPRARGGSFFLELARSGHFGRPDLDLPWEKPLPIG